MKYSEILERNKELGNSLGGDSFTIKVLSNIIVHQLNEVLEYTLRSEKLNAEVVSGNYDNIVQDAASFEKEKVAVIFWEVSNLLDGFEYKADNISSTMIDDLLEKVKGEMSMVLNSLNNVPLVIFNKFNSLQFNASLIEENTLDRVVSSLNNFLHSFENQNLHLVDLNKVFVQEGINNCIDYRNYYSSKALYTVDFFRNYAEHIKHVILPMAGLVKKALVLDCDNTLWKGILGEDGFEGIQMSASSSKGKPFEAIQHMAVKLSNDGVLIGLCSKNNAQDVEEVLVKHKNLTLKDENITIKKVNWSDKASNLREMAKTLNIGLDSFVFVDDSDFEVGLIRSELPEIKVFQVNSKNYRYPVEFSEVINSFFNKNRTEEDKKKVQMYKEQALRESSKDSYTDMNDYLMSLGIEIEIEKNSLEHVPRMAQMTQKTNQFNLTTRRYSEAEMKEMVLSDDFNTYSLSVKDKYGDSGITGLAIMKYDDSISIVDTFLLSCRVIGRGIEDEFMNHIIQDSKHSTVLAEYLRTKKNDQVSELYDKFGFEIVAEDEQAKKYCLNKKNYTAPKSTHILIRNGRKA